MLPSLFIAHGAPTLAVEKNAYTDALKELAGQLKRPRAIVIFSAHWESPVQEIGSADVFSTIHDFGGFPRELYEIQYPAAGDRLLAEETATLLRSAGVSVRFHPSRGLDHGAWVVLRLMYPDADIPVVPMSVNPALTPQEQYDIGRALRALRRRDILIIGSGGTVHNFAKINMWAKPGQADEWAVQFEEWLAETLTAWDLPALYRYRELAPYANWAVPRHGSEHFVPLLYAMGAADDDRRAQRLHLSFQLGSLSHVIWQFGAGTD
ncbi:dioxygenase family protein [Brevibacillus aydinogluensis]|jgi:4,5-DOPA dioxygenase extradiol|uniref:Dioxygenase n=1 Tax=Brevibacillus aydinogluensis TaxID=927786 RepID=A0AA48RDH9_9BACL|nr:class III extradiol ring-cleavage dioxygenase [Brevibacillus aydinogluensis]CAJ1003997.1 Dioxygenase [Brevibacillus aydinogluensis]